MGKYPASGAEAGLRLFRRWLGSRFTRAVRPDRWTEDGPIGQGVLEIARRWPLRATIVNTLTADADPAWDTARAQIEESLDRAGLNLAVFVPRNAPLPTGETGVAEFTVAARAAVPAPGGRLEIRRPVPLRLRRVDHEGSVITIAGGLSAHWARFTNRVSGTFHLDSAPLFRLPADEAERESIFDRIVEAAEDAAVDAGLHVDALDAWTAVDLEEGGSAVLGTPHPDDDQWGALLRRNTRKLLARATELDATGETGATTALAILGAATNADEERLSWVLRGMDPAVYGHYDIVAVIVDGTVRAMLEPATGTLPWD